MLHVAVVVLPYAEQPIKDAGSSPFPAGEVKEK